MFALVLIVIAIVVIIVAGVVTHRNDDDHHHLGDECTDDVIVMGAWHSCAGFGYVVFNVLMALHAAETCMPDKNTRVVIQLESGFYLEKRPRFTRAIRDYQTQDWFSHYFAPVNTTDKSAPGFSEKWKTPQGIVRFSKGSVPKKDKTKRRVFAFERPSIDSVPRTKDLDHKLHDMWVKHIHIRPEIQAEVDRVLVQSHASRYDHLVSVAFRGTDKFALKTGRDDDPVHVPYEFVLSTLRKEIKTQLHSTPDRVGVIVASDERPFVEFMKSQLDLNIIVYEEAVRADVSTSGLIIDTTVCDGSPSTRDLPACKVVADMVKKSIHRGMPSVSKYKKGKDVLIDMLLLSRGETFLRSRGNVSNVVRYISPDARVVDMATEWNKTQGLGKNSAGVKA
jgi:hypothetical protein